MGILEIVLPVAVSFVITVIAGKLLPGDAFRCGEAGHMTLIPDGKPCYCGKTGCVDAYCSARLLSDLSGGRLEDSFSDFSRTPRTIVLSGTPI